MRRSAVAVLALLALAAPGCGGDDEDGAGERAQTAPTTETAQTAPTETAPAETAPTETAPAETAPAETAPAGGELSDADYLREWREREPPAGNTPEDVVVREYLFIQRRQYGRAWDELHPAHQAVVERDDFEDCFARQRVFDFAARVTSVEEVPFDVPGVGEVEAARVEARLIGDGGVTQPDRSHVVEVDGRWRWVLSRRWFETFERGGCPAEGA